MQQLRNNGGPRIAEAFHPRKDGYTKVAYLKRDTMEHLSLKKSRLVTAWRIVSADGIDLVQPWSHLKSEAEETAAQLGFYLASQAG